MARPPIEIDAELVFKFAQMGCRTKEIADYFGCCEDTITNRFSVELTKGRADLRMSIRQWQLQAAKKGNVVMQIWLGKQMLGQQDTSRIDLGKIPDDILIEEARNRLGQDEPEGS